MKTSNTESMKSFSLIQIMLLVLCLTTSCKNHYNDMIEWTDRIENGKSIEGVKHEQPDFVTIDWARPDTVEDKLLYPITKIAGNNDILDMNHYLVFIDNKYEGRESHK